MQSEELKKVNLKVSNTSYSFTKMFGTEVGWVDGTPQDPCSGDSGGPLMLKSSGRWIIIGSLEFKCKKFISMEFHKKFENDKLSGTVKGEGYACGKGENSTWEGTHEGIWNKVDSKK